MPEVILVDSTDRPIGSAEKLRAHLEGRLHRAFSIFLFRSDGRMRLQRRADSKYHSGGLWSNACCGHPVPGETLEAAAHRRLSEEMGLDCDLWRLFSFTYKKQVTPDLFEHEIDHVFVGRTDSEPSPDVEEVKAWRDMHPVDLIRELAARPESFTAWFPIALRELVTAHLSSMRALSIDPGDWSEMSAFDGESW